MVQGQAKAQANKLHVSIIVVVAYILLIRKFAGLSLKYIGSVGLIEYVEKVTYLSHKHGHNRWSSKPHLPHTLKIASSERCPHIVQHTDLLPASDKLNREDKNSSLSQFACKMFSVIVLEFKLMMTQYSGPSLHNQIPKLGLFIVFVSLNLKLVLITVCLIAHCS